MPPQTRKYRLAQLDARLQVKRRELAEAADPDDLATLREDIDDLLEERLAAQQ